jgi:hypothetical protein
MAKIELNRLLALLLQGWTEFHGILLQNALKESTQPSVASAINRNNPVYLIDFDRLICKRKQREECRFFSSHTTTFPLQASHSYVVLCRYEKITRRHNFSTHPGV